MPIAHIAGRPTTTLSTDDHYIGRGMVVNPIGMRDLPNRIAPHPATKLMLSNPGQNIQSSHRNTHRPGRSCTVHKMDKRGACTQAPHFTVTPNNEWFLYYSVGSVQLGNRQECKNTSIRKILIRLPNESMITLHYVRHVPDLARSPVCSC